MRERERERERERRAKFDEKSITSPHFPFLFILILFHFSSIPFSQTKHILRELRPSRGYDFWGQERAEESLWLLRPKKVRLRRGCDCWGQEGAKEMPWAHWGLKYGAILGLPYKHGIKPNKYGFHSLCLYKGGLGFVCLRASIPGDANSICWYSLAS